jgi:predicted RNase H-like HicB family nuclease
MEMQAYTSQEACRLAGISYRQLDYWVRQMAIRPAQPARGSGSARRWSSLEIVQLRVMSELRKAGISLPRVRRAVNWLRKALSKVALDDLVLVTDGREIFYLSPNPGKLVDVLAGERLVLSIPVGETLRKVGRELPTGKSKDLAYYDLPEVVEPGESGYFVGYCPVLRGCVAQGKTREEAQANLKKAIASYLAVLGEMAQDEAEQREGRREAVPA